MPVTLPEMQWASIFQPIIGERPALMLVLLLFPPVCRECVDAGAVHGQEAEDRGGAEEQGRQRYSGVLPVKGSFWVIHSFSLLSRILDELSIHMSSPLTSIAFVMHPPDTSRPDDRSPPCPPPLCPPVATVRVTTRPRGW
jgi:hypothetical protein